MAEANKKKKIEKKLSIGSIVRKLTGRSKIGKKDVHKEPLCIGSHGGKLYLLYRVVSSEGQQLYITSGPSGTAFTGAASKISIIGTRKQEDVSRMSDFRFSSKGKQLVLTYLRHSQSGASLVYASSTDKKKWKIEKVFLEIKTPGVLYQHAPTVSSIYFGDQVLRIALGKCTSVPRWNIVVPPRVPYWHFFDGVPFSVAGIVETAGHIAVFYSAEHKVDIMKDVQLRDEKIGEERLLKIGLALFSTSDPSRLIWQSELPIVEVPLETHGSLRVLGAVTTGRKNTSIRLYTSSESGDIGYVEIPEEVLIDHKDRKPLELKRAKENPILSPTHLEWERDGSFNPAAIFLNDKVHLIYRAAGTDGFSKIGYASSKDGVHIDERLTKPIYTPKYWFEYKDEKGDVASNLFASGGGWGGCEDPKVTQIENRIYMTYVAHTGVWPTRTVLTSISVDDFLNKRWKWSKPQLMSPPGVGSKSVVIMPEKVDGKYVIFHRRWPNVYVDKVDNLEFGEGKQWLGEKDMIRTRKSYWDSQKMSIGGTPIKTPDGWLVIYNAVDRLDSSKYKIGAMLLDLRHPEKVLARTRKPILSPEEFYENDGKPGVAYPGGSVVMNDILNVYYGGGDKVSCVAQIPVAEVLAVLKKNMKPEGKIKPVKK